MEAITSQKGMELYMSSVLAEITLQLHHANRPQLRSAFTTLLHTMLTLWC